MDKHICKVAVFIETENNNRVYQILNQILKEYGKASEKFEPFHSMHEGGSVLREEFEELWDNIKLNADKHPNRLELIREESIQVAAMAMRIVYDSYSSELDKTKDGKEPVESNEQDLDTVKFEEFTQTYCEKCVHPENCTGNLSDCKEINN